MKKVWRIGGSVLLLAVLAWRLDWHQVGSCLVQLSWVVWAQVVGIYFAAQVVSSFRWQMLARPLGLTGPWQRFTAYYFIGMLFNLVLPTSVGGDVVRAWYLARERPGTTRPAVLSVLADRLSGLAVLVVLGCLTALLGPVRLPGWLLGVVLGLGAGLTLAAALFPLAGHLTRLPLVGTRIAPFVEVAREYRSRPGLIVSSTILSVLVQGSNAVLLGILGAGMGLHVPPVYYGVVATLVPLWTLLPVSVNGLGLREVGVVLLLAPVGVPEAQAVTLSLLWFVACSSTALPGLGFYLAGGFPRFEAERQEAEAPVVGGEFGEASGRAAA